MKLVKTDRLPASYCGADVKLSVEGAFQIVEDMVTEIMGDQHIDGVTCMREYGGMWVFVRNRIEMDQPLEWMETYTATSYISSFSKIRLYIDTVLQKEDGSIALKSRLEMCAVDLETGKIRKSESVGVGDKTPPEEPMFDIAYSKEKPVREELIDEVTVRSADIDYCHHTNNISYVRYVMNQFNVDELIERPVKAIEVQYAAQTHEGDRLSLFRCSCGAGSEAFVIELGGTKAVSCLINR
jgi:acyl-ACP thioesterase